MQKAKNMKTPKKECPHLLQRPDTLVSEMLTPEEIEQLRQEKREMAAYVPKAFVHLKPKINLEIDILARIGVKESLEGNPQEKIRGNVSTGRELP